MPGRTKISSIAVRAGTLWRVVTIELGCWDSKRNRFKTSSTAVLAIVLWAGITMELGCWDSQKTKVEKLLAEAKLSPLPKSASNIAYYQWNGLFTGETYAKFDLDAGDMSLFISNSPAVTNLKPTLFETNRHHIPYPASSGFPSLDHEYYQLDAKFPDWFDISIRGRGRRYVLPWGPNMDVSMDEERRVVLLRVVKG